MSTVTTPRRSGRLRGNPLVVRKPQPRLISDIYTWVSDPIHSRPIIREDFIDDAEWEQANNYGDEDEDNKLREELTTDFYGGFEVTGKRRVGRFAKYTRGVNNRSNGKGKTEEAEEWNKVGDTVLVTSANKLPSVGVIVGMWENRWKTEEGKDTQKMRIKIHWFLRPTELAGIRAKRECAVVRILLLIY